MTKRFEQAIAEIRKLPDDRQDQVAELLIELASEDADPPSLTPDRVEGVRLALRQTDLRQSASDASFTGLGNEAAAYSCGGIRSGAHPGGKKKRAELLFLECKTLGCQVSFNIEFIIHYPWHLFNL